MIDDEISKRKCAADAYLREMTAIFHGSIAGPHVRPGAIQRADVEAYQRALNFWLVEEAETSKPKEIAR